MTSLEGWARQHDDGIDPYTQLIEDLRPRFHTQRSRLFTGHHEQRRGSIGNLRRGAGGELAVLLKGGLEVGERIDRCFRTNALVDSKRAPVEADRQDLAVESALARCRSGPRLRAHAEFAESFA
jgi:hypothetical protein